MGLSKSTIQNHWMYKMPILAVNELQSRLNQKNGSASQHTMQVWEYTEWQWPQLLPPSTCVRSVLKQGDSRDNGIDHRKGTKSGCGPRLDQKFWRNSHNVVRVVSRQFCQQIFKIVNMKEPSWEMTEEELSQLNIWPSLGEEDKWELGTLQWQYHEYM